MLMLPEAMKKVGQKGVNAAKEELCKLHERTCFRALAFSELTRQEKERAMVGLMFAPQK